MIEDNCNEFKWIFFNFKGIINYILKLYFDPSTLKKDKNNYHIESLPVKSEFNMYYDLYLDDIVSNIDKTKFIYFRKTEFGNSFTKDKLILIAKYLFNINSINSSLEFSKFLNEDKKDFIQNTGIKYNQDILIRIISYNQILPLLRKPNQEINSDQIPLIEYCYFLSLPKLIQKKENKPKILILSNDYGMLNYYYNKLYPNIFDLQSFMEDEKFFIKNDKIFKINYDNIKIKAFNKVIKDYKKKKSKKYDLIILEYFYELKENNISIPNQNHLFNMKNLLSDEGIFAYNLRAESIELYNNIIDSQKKIYNKVIEIKIRTCSGIIICSQNTNIQFLNYYNPIIKNELGFDNFKSEFENNNN